MTTSIYRVRTMFAIVLGPETRALPTFERQEHRRAECRRIAAQIRAADHRIHVETRTPQVALVTEVEATNPYHAVAVGAERFHKAHPSQRRGEALVRATRKD